MFAQLALAVFPLLMAFAAASDLLTMRISNALVLAIAISFLVLALVVGMPLAAIGMHLVCALAVLVVAFGLFALGWIGGGDAKLAAATALWIGFGGMLAYLAYAGVLGGILTLALLGARQVALPVGLMRVEWIARLHNHKTGIPYGIALAAAGLLVYSDTQVFVRLIG